MTSGVLITLTICTTIILLFGTIMIAAVVLSKQKKQDPPAGNSAGPHMQFTAKDDAIDGIQDQPKYGQRRKDGKH